MSTCIFTKYSNERCREFSIRTDIMEGEGRRFVVKRPLYPEGEAHVKRLISRGARLSQDYGKISMCANRCEVYEDGVLLEYVEGCTLKERLDMLLGEGRTELVRKELADYLQQIASIYSDEEFMVTDDFKKVFGYVRLPRGLRCAAVTNIDMVCENLVLTETPTVLDYEWTFDFPVPCHYVLYRVLQYYVDTHTARQVLDVDSIYEQLGITEEERLSYQKMEENFQNYITGNHVPVRDLYEDMCPGIMPVQMMPQEQLQVYFSFGKGYEECNSVRLPIRNRAISCDIDIPVGCTDVRIDPGDGVYAVKLEKTAFDGKRVSLEACPARGGILIEDRFYVVDKDPGIEKIPVPSGAKVFSVSLKLEEASFEVLKKVYEQQLLIQDMKGTRVWRMYESYRKKVERKR